MADTKGKVKRASKKFMLFSAALQQNVLKSYVARFSAHDLKTVLQQISLLQVAKSFCRMQRVVLTVATKSVHVSRFAGPRKTCFAISDVQTPAYDLTRSRVISVKVSFHATYNNLICFKKGLVCGR